MRIKTGQLGFVGSLGSILTTGAAVVYFSQMTSNVGKGFLYLLGAIVALCALPGIMPTQFLKQFEAWARARPQEWRSLLEVSPRNPLEARVGDELQRLTLWTFPVFDRIAAGQQFTLTDQPEEAHIVLREVEIDGVVFQPIRIEPGRFAVQHLDPKSVYFGIRVKGESMIGLGIEAGDVALVRQGGDVDNGQVVAVRIEDETTLKRIFVRWTHVLLKPENDAEPSIIIVPNSQMESDVRQHYSEADGYEILIEPDVKILGAVVAVFKPMR